MNEINSFNRAHVNLINEAISKDNIPLDIFIELDNLNSSQRMSIFSAYCCHCGEINPHCQCWNDE